MSKISELSDGGSLLPTDDLIVVRSGGNVRVKADTINVDQIRLGDNEKIELGNAQDLQIYWDGSTGKITNNIDVTGSVTVDGTGAEVISVNSTANGSQINFDSATTSSDWSVGIANDSTDDFLIYQAAAGSGDIKLYTDGKERLEVNNNGDISFYEDTGTTPKLFWDASAESLGIGTSTVNADLHLGAASPHIDIGPSTGNRGKVGFDSNNVYIGSTSGTGEIHFKNNIGSTDAPHSSGDTKMVIADSGVGIGTSNPSAYPVASSLVVDAGTNGGVTIKSGTNGYGGVFFADGTTGNEQYRGSIQYNHDYVGATDALLFSTAAAERLRIDSLGGITAASQAGGHVVFNSNTTDSDFRVAYNNGTHALYVDGATGNVGIGTGSPDYLLHLEKAGGVMAQLKATDSNQAYMKLVNSTTGDGEFTDGLLFGLDSDESTVLWNYEATATRFATSGSERMRIDSAGNVGIGTTPSTNWVANNVLQIGTKASFSSSSSFSGFATNIVATSSGWTTKYTTAGAASAYLQATSDGGHRFYTAPVGTAGATATLSERMRIDASGNLLLNTTNSPTTTKAIISSDYSATGTTNTGLTLTGRQSGNWWNNGIHALGSSGLAFSTGTTGITGADVANERMRIDSSGNLNLKKNLVLESTSEGIDFGGVGSSAQTLDDYEEGTWTPAYLAVTGVATYETQTGSYTKIGNKVMVAGVLQAKRNTLSGTTVISGLPFAVDGNGGGVHINFALNFATDMPNLKGYTSGSQINFRTQATNSSASSPLIETNLSDSATTHNYLYFTAHYFTT